MATILMNQQAHLSPTRAELVARAQEIIPRLTELARYHDEQKRVSDEAIQLLRDAGFFRIVQSIESGGFGLNPGDLWAVTREIGRGCSSTAWILALAGLHPWVVGMFGQQAQDEVFADGGDAVVPVLSGGVGRDMRCEDAGDSFMLSGRWTYGSGIDVADWVGVVFPGPQNEGAPQRMLALVPQSEFTILHDSWNVMGMRGTGSKDVALENVQIPKHRVISWEDAQIGEFPKLSRPRDASYRYPINAVFALSVAAGVVAVAHGALDLYLGAVRKRVSNGTAKAQVEDRLTHVEAGQIAAQLHMAYALLQSDCDEIVAIAESDTEFDETLRARYRVDAAHVARTALAAADRMFRGLGGSILPNGPIEKAFRDIHAMASHFLVQPEIGGELYGRKLLGLELPAGARL